MADLLQVACELAEVDPKRVVTHTSYEQEDEYVILADHGIGGIKKYCLSLATVTAAAEAAEAKAKAAKKTKSTSSSRRRSKK